MTHRLYVHFSEKRPLGPREGIKPPCTIQTQVEGNGVKCPNCGAENADSLYYCGSCASPLRDIPARDSGTSRQEVTAESVLDSDSAHKAKVQQAMRRTALIFAALSAMWLLLAADPILRGELDYYDIAHVSFAGLLAALAIYTYWMGTNDEVLSFIRLAGWVGKTSAEVPGFDLNQMLLVLAAIVAGATLSLLTAPASDIPIASAITIALAGLIVLVIVYRSKVSLEDNGICIGSKYRSRQFIALQKISSIRLKKNILIVSLIKRHPFFFKTHRFLLLGNVEAMRNEIDRIAPSGIPTLVYASSQQPLPESAKPEIVFIGAYKSSLTTAGILLTLAGLFAFMTAAIFFVMDSNTSRPGGSPLFCCGILEVIFGAMAILGGLLTIRRIKYNLAMTAAVLAIISVGGGFSLVLGIIALVMIHRSRGDFVD